MAVIVLLLVRALAFLLPRTAGGDDNPKHSRLRNPGLVAGAAPCCYVRDTMSETTTIRLPPKLRARLRAIARDTDRSVHSLILEAVEKHAAYEEQMRKLVTDALAADEEVDRTGEVYRAEDVHAWVERLAKGVGSPKPKPLRK